MQSIIEATRNRLVPFIGNGPAPALTYTHSGDAPAGVHSAGMHRLTRTGIPQRNYQDLEWMVPISWL